MRLSKGVQDEVPVSGRPLMADARDRYGIMMGHVIHLHVFSSVSGRLMEAFGLTRLRIEDNSKRTCINLTQYF